VFLYGLVSLTIVDCSNSFIRLVSGGDLNRLTTSNDQDDRGRLGTGRGVTGHR
jgi:hypothetical protein